MIGRHRRGQSILPSRVLTRCHFGGREVRSPPFYSKIDRRHLLVQEMAGIPMEEKVWRCVFLQHRSKFYLSCRMAQIAHAPVFIIPRVETATAPLAFRARAHCHLPLLVRVALRPDRIWHPVQVGRRSRDHTPANRRHVGDRGDPQLPGGSEGAIFRVYLVRHAAGGRIHPREFARQRVLGR